MHNTPNPTTLDFPESDEFIKSMGQISWLMTVSKEHRDKPISLIERLVSTSLMFKQTRVFMKGKQPLAAIMWAYVSPELKLVIEQGGYDMLLEDWRSGTEIVIIDCISPFVPKDQIIKHFESQIAQAQNTAMDNNQ